MNTVRGLLILFMMALGFSGSIAAAAFKAIELESYDAVIVIAFQHRAPFPDISMTEDFTEH